MTSFTSCDGTAELKCVHHTYQSWKQLLYFEKARTTENDKKGNSRFIKLDRPSISKPY